MIRHDEGVSSVIGAILLAGILAGAFLTVRVAFVPQWLKENEAATARALEHDLRTLGASAAAGVTVPLHLVATDGNVFTPPGIAGDVVFDPAGGAMTFTAPEMAVWGTPGDSGASSETWRPVGATTTVANVSALTGLRLRMLSQVSEWNDGDAVTIRARDANGALAGSLRVGVVDHPSGFDVVVTVRDAQGTIVYDQAEAYFIQDPIPSFWLDTLRSDFRFAHALARAQAPLALDIVTANVRRPGMNADLAADYAVSYERTLGSATVLSDSSVLRAPFADTRTAGALHVTLRPQHYPPQRWTYEAGAVGLAQADGHATKLAPDVSITKIAGVTTVQIRTVVLEGVSSSMSSTGTPRLRATPTGSDELVGSAPSLTLAFRSTEPRMWETAWSAAVSGAGLQRNEYELRTQGGTVSLTLFGSSTGNIHDVVLDYAEVRTLVALDP